MAGMRAGLVAAAFCSALIATASLREISGTAQVAKSKSSGLSQAVHLDSVPESFRVGYRVSRKPEVSVADASQGFESLARLYGEAPQGGAAFQADVPLLLPEGLKIDFSYQQTDLHCCGGGATSTATPTGTPRGFRLIVDGGYYWSVPVNPHLEPVNWDYSTGVVTQWKLVVPMYCGPGGRPEPGCNIKVDVYYKRKQ